MSYKNWLKREEKRLRDVFETSGLKENFEGFARETYQTEMAQEKVFKQVLKKSGQRCRHCGKMLALKE